MQSNGAGTITLATEATSLPLAAFARRVFVLPAGDTCALETFAQNEGGSEERRKEGRKPRNGRRRGTGRQTTMGRDTGASGFPP